MCVSPTYTHFVCAVANNVTTHSSWLDTGMTHLWRVVGVEATPGAVWTRAGTGWTLHGHLRDELSQRAGRYRWRAARVGRDVEGQSCRRAGEPPVGCRFPCLVVHRRLVAQCVALRDRGQVPHGVRKLSVLLVLNGQTGELRQQAHSLDYKIMFRSSKT